MGRRNRAKRATVPAVAPDLPTPEQLARSRYDQDFVTHVDTATKALAYRNRESTVLERWIGEGAFEEPQLRVIADCLALWARMPSQRVTARYGERMASGVRDDGIGAQNASQALSAMQAMVPGKYWTVFENVVRFNLAAGVAASGVEHDAKRASHAAKLTVSFVTNIIAMNLRY